MRLPYTPNPPLFTDPTEVAILSRVQPRRAPHALIPLDLTLLPSPPVADGWNSFLGAIRTRSSLPADVRETAICRVAAINEAWFEWKSHVPILRGDGGVDETGVDEVRTG